MQPGPASSDGDRLLRKKFVFLSEGLKHAVHQKLFQVRLIRIRFDQALKRWPSRNLDLGIQNKLSPNTRNL